MSTDDIPGLTPVNPETTAALVARRLREIMAQGHFRPGQQLVEVELAKKFGVSRGVLREAMQRLTQEGLLVSRPNRGVFVAEFGPEEVFDIYTARLAIERAACLKVIDVLGSAEALADELDALSDQLDAGVREGADTDVLVALDVAFHEHIVAFAQSPRLNRMHATLATESKMCLSTFESRAYPLEHRITEHREIAIAIRRRDVPRLHALLAEHMDNAVAMIIRSFDDQPSDQS